MANCSGPPALRLAFGLCFPNFAFMALPEQPVTLSVEQIDELNKKLSTMRHDVNNHLSMVMAAAELVRLKPELGEKMLGRLIEQPTKISEAIKQFSVEFEKTLGVRRS
jgi:hypothetical protein